MGAADVTAVFASGRSKFHGMLRQACFTMRYGYKDRRIDAKPVTTQSAEHPHIFA